MRNVVLTTERLILRELVESDFDDVHEYDSDPEVSRYMNWGPNTPEDTRNFMQGVIESQRAQPRTRYELAVTLKSTDKLIGMCSMPRMNLDIGEAEVGYSLNRGFWGEGYTTEATRAILGLGFDQLNLHRMFATCDTRNIGSYRVMEKIGMRREAHFIEKSWQKGAWRDSYLYAILDREWIQQTKEG